VTRAADLARSADEAAAATLGGDVVHPALGIVVLVVVAALNIHEPSGLTGFGQRRQPARRAPLLTQEQGQEQSAGSLDRAD